MYDTGGCTVGVSLLTIEDMGNRIANFCLQDFKRKDRDKDIYSVAPADCPAQVGSSISSELQDGEPHHSRLFCLDISNGRLVLSRRPFDAGDLHFGGCQTLYGRLAMFLTLLDEAEFWTPFCVERSLDSAGSHHAIRRLRTQCERATRIMSSPTQAMS